MSKWMLIALLALQVHFAASYLVPLDEPSQKAFGGLLRWFWPWAYGNGGPLGPITPVEGFPITGFFLAATAATLLALAALAAAGWWVPTTWWRVLATGGAVLLACLMVLFFSPTKVLPLGVALATCYLAVWHPAALAPD